MGTDPSKAIITYVFKEHTLSVTFCSQNRTSIKGIIYLKEGLPQNTWFTLDHRLEDAQSYTKDMLVKPVQKVILPHFLPFQRKTFQSSALFINSCMPKEKYYESEIICK